MVKSRKKKYNRFNKKGGANAAEMAKLVELAKTMKPTPEKNASRGEADSMKEVVDEFESAHSQLWTTCWLYYCK